MNMVVCPEPPAAKVGRDVFAQGGNAVDAAIAAAFAQAVTNPLLCGLGGTGLVYYHDGRKNQGLVLNAEVSIGSRPVPESWVEEYVGRAETVGRYIVESEANQVGHQSVMVPGFVRGCWVAFQRFGSGRLSWAELLAPSVGLARRGFEVYPYIAAFWRHLEERPGYPGLMTKLHATPGATRFYLKPDRSPYEEGDRFIQPELADTIQRLAEAGGEDFYTGEIARAISEDMAKHGGFITAEDLQDFPVKEDPPLRGGYRGLEVTSTPFSSGAHIIQMLQVLEHFDLVKLGHNTPEYIDTFARVQRATFADNVRLKGLSREDEDPLQEQVIRPERAAYWADRIRRGERIIVRGGAADGGTTHVTCMDSDRNVVTFTHSIGSLAGSGVITPGLGFLYNNFLGHYNPLPGHPDSIVPGKKLGGGLPAIILKEGKPYIAIGAPGGSRLITSVVQSIVNVVDHHMDMRTAVTVPRFHSEEEQLLFLEPAFPESTAEALRAMGNTVQRSTYMSRVQAILVRQDTGDLEAGPDPRGGAGVGRYPDGNLDA
jgi:gamma-glutamyltranspeptidase/glutathione hydrolase